MKKYHVFFGLLISSTLFISCIDTNSPEAVTEKFLFCFAKFDFETAKSISTRSTWELITIMDANMKEFSEEEKKKKEKDIQIKITSREQETDSTVIVSYQTTPQILPFSRIRLLRQYDKEGRERWKVDISTLEMIAEDDLYNEDSLIIDSPMIMHNNPDDTTSVPNQE